MSISDLISYMYMYNSYDKAILTEWFSDLAYWANPAFQTKVNETHQVKLILYPPSV